MDQDSVLPFELPAVSRKKVSAAFDGGMLSSDAGVLLLRGVERRLGVARRLAHCLQDRRDAGRITHGLEDMLRLRMFAIAAGYEDANDCDKLRTDPVFKMAVGRAPASGERLCSQPTMSRLENAPSRIEIARMMGAMVDQFCASYARRPASIILDIDDTVDAVHGHQQLSLFNAHYDERCFLPVHIYEGTSGKLVAAILRAGKTPSGAEVRTILKHVIARIRRHLAQGGDPGARRQPLWPARSDELVRRKRGRLHVRPERQQGPRGDGSAGCREAAPALGAPAPGRRQAAHLAQAALRRRPMEDHAAGNRPAGGERPRPRHPLRRHLAGGEAKYLYETVYCARGQAENFIKLHKAQLASDRTSCRDPRANQVRLILHSAAYWLLHTLRAATPKRSVWARMEFATLRLRLIKIAARVVEGAARIRISLPTACPDAAVFRLLAGRFAAVGP
jgi:Transposase DDE domain group 1